ncbi:MAG: hypothetical protein H7Z17_06825 [Fuerstia sp.]|nr:hypothetical protein [Fuerstiella sp.]
MLISIVALLRSGYDTKHRKASDKAGSSRLGQSVNPRFLDRWIDAVMPHAVANESFNGKPQASATWRGRCRLRLAVKR